MRGRTISNFRQRLLYPLEVGGRNQEVEIGKTSQAHVAVSRLREQGPLVRDYPQLPALEVLHDAHQFGGEPQAAPQVRVVRRLQHALNSRGEAAAVLEAIMIDQVAGHERKNSMVFRQA